LERATPATTDDNLLPFAFPAVERKKVTAALDPGRTRCQPGIHRLPDILRARQTVRKVVLSGFRCGV
jgi:hypothetical protein